MELIHKTVGKEVHLPYQIVAKRGYSCITLERIRKGDIPITKRYTIVLPKEHIIESQNVIFEFTVFERNPIHKIPKNNYTKWFDYDKIRDTVELRTRQTGDYIQIN